MLLGLIQNKQRVIITETAHFIPSVFLTKTELQICFFLTHDVVHAEGTGAVL